MSRDDDEERSFERLLEAVRHDEPPEPLAERILEHVAYRSRLERMAAAAFARQRYPLALALPGLVLAAAGALLAVSRIRSTEQKIVAETPSGTQPVAAPAAGTTSARAPQAAVPDPCRERGVASGNQPEIDDFEDGDDAIEPLEGRTAFWRWAREIDAPGSAPALLPVVRPGASRENRLAQHVKGSELVDWGATVEFTFRPGCYDASKYAGVSFQARGPGRLYVAPREVSVIPIAEGGTCDHDCHNPHVSKVDLDATWRVYRIRWSDLRQRGVGKPPLDPSRLNSLAFLIRVEDTPYDIWIDDVRFLQP